VANDGEHIEGCGRCGGFGSNRGWRQSPRRDLLRAHPITTTCPCEIHNVPYRPENSTPHPHGHAPVKWAMITDGTGRASLELWLSLRRAASELPSHWDSRQSIPSRLRSSLQYLRHRRRMRSIPHALRVAATIIEHEATSASDNHGALTICLHAGDKPASVSTGFGLGGIKGGGGRSVDSLNQKSSS
jgi:hypothetical protein